MTVMQKAAVRWCHRAVLLLPSWLCLSFHILFNPFLSSVGQNRWVLQPVLFSQRSEQLPVCAVERRFVVAVVGVGTEDLGDKPIVQLRITLP